jgi:hypothetical protein
MGKECYNKSENEKPCTVKISHKHASGEGRYKFVLGETVLEELLNYCGQKDLTHEI